MSKTRDTGFLGNVVKVDSNGDISLMHGSTMLMQISSSGAITTTGVISGSNALSASYAVNTSYLNNSGSGEFVPTGSFNTFSSSILTYTGSANSRFSSLETTSGSNITRIAALETASGSAITRLSAIEVVTGSNISRLNSIEAKTGSYATTGSNIFVGSQTITGSILGSGSLSINGCIVSTGQIVAQTINVQQVTSSIVYSCGSNIFGCAITDTQQMTGSLRVTGSLNVVGSTCTTMVNASCIGIGTTSPSRPLHVVGNGYFYNGSANSSTSVLIQGGRQYELTADASGGGSPVVASGFIIKDNSAGVERLVINASGNVGINTTVPLSRFDVALLSGESLTIGNCSNTITCGDLIGALTFVSRDGSTNSTGGIAGIRSYATQTYNTGGVEGDLRFYTSIVNTQPNGTILSGNEVLKLSQDGVACFASTVCAPHFIGINNISIGGSCTTSDGYNTRLRISNIANDTFVFSFNNQACKAIMYMYGGNTNNPQGYTAWVDNASGNTNHLIGHTVSQATYFAIQGGCVGIGTSSPTAALQIRRDAIGIADVLTLQNEYTTPGVTAGQGIGIKFIGSGGARDWGAIRMTSCDTSSDNYFMSFHVRNATNTVQERMRITNSGLIGINTTTPVAALQVVCTPGSFYGIIETTGCSTGTVKHFRVHKPNCVEYGVGILDNNAYHISTASTFPTANGFTLASNGNVGFGECSPGTDKMVINGGTANNNIWLRLKTDGSHGIKPSIHFDSGLVGTNRSSKVVIMGGYSSPDGGAGGALVIYTNDTSENSQQRMCIDPRGAVTIMGALAKGSGSFRICHPLSSKVKTHALVHSFIEGPNADLIYSGHTKLTNGVACINIDCISRMTEGTFEALNRCVRIFTTNETSWDAVKGKVLGNMVIIESQNNNSEDQISWMVIGERQDRHMFDTDWTDSCGRVITEPEIVIVDDNNICFV